MIYRAWWLTFKPEILFEAGPNAVVGSDYELVTGQLFQSNLTLFTKGSLFRNQATAGSVVMI